VRIRRTSRDRRTDLRQEFKPLSQRDERSSPASGFRGRLTVRKDDGVRASTAPTISRCTPPPVDDAQGFQTRAVRFLEISFDSCPDLLGQQGMEVKDIAERDANRFLVLVHSRSNAPDPVVGNSGGSSSGPLRSFVVVWSIQGTESDHSPGLNLATFR
jgi:hypothetical protein